MGSVKMMAPAPTLGSLILLSLSVINAQAQVTCSRGQTCTPLRSCSEAATLLKEAETSSDTERRLHIVGLLRGRVCNKADRSVCCASGVSSSGSRPSSSSSSSGLKSLGTFRNIFHDISGEAFAVDSETILIKGFTYDGEGPDTFFLAGSSGKPSRSGEWVLPWPADGKRYSYNDDIPLIKRSFDGSEDITLKMPPGADVKDIKWISVWCRDFNVNFGHVNVI